MIFLFLILCPVVFSITVSADDFSEVVIYAMLVYLEDPASSSITAEELLALMDFYSGLSPDDDFVEYVLKNEKNIFAKKYLLSLPDKQKLLAEVQRVKEKFEKEN